MAEAGGEPALGQALGGRYRLEAVIGEGTTGRVYRGRDEVLGRLVAVKVLRAALAADPAVMARFARAARASAALDDAHTVLVYDYAAPAAAGAPAYLVQQLVDGPDLGTLLDRRGPLSPGRACAIVDAVLAALAGAHQRGLAHRGVAPRNVLVDDDGDGPARLTDFGVAQLDVRANAATLLDADAPARAGDLFAAAALLRACLAGAAAHPSAYGHPPPGAPPALAALLARALDPDPARRFPDAPTLRAALAAAAAADGVPLPAGGVPPPAAAGTHEQATRQLPVVPALAPDAADDSAPVAAWVGDPDAPRRDLLTAVPRARARRPAALGTLLLLVTVALLGTVGFWWTDAARRGAPTPSPALVAAVPPTALSAPTATAVPPTALSAPTATAVPPAATSAPTATAVPPTATPAPTATAVPPTATPAPTATAVRPTATPAPTARPSATAAPPTATAAPTGVPVPLATAPPTRTAPPAPTSIPPTSIPPIATRPAPTPAPTPRPIALPTGLGPEQLVGAYRRDDGMLYGRPAAALYAAGTGYARGTLTFTLADAPVGPVTLVLLGIDDERPARVGFRVVLNGAPVFAGPSPFPAAPANDVGVGGAPRVWGEARFPLPAGALRAGRNELVLENTEPGAALGVPYVLIARVDLVAAP